MKSTKKIPAQADSVQTAAELPISALLSFALVAFTIEIDNEFEHRMPHRISNLGAAFAGIRRGPWLTSLVMYSTCLRFVVEKGIRASELETLARTPTNLNGIERWGYITIAPDPNDRRPKPPRSDWLIRATPAALLAREVWRPLFGEVETRWRERFGEKTFNLMEKSLRELVAQFDSDLPDCLPILQYGLLCKRPSQKKIATRPENKNSTDEFSLVALLSKALLAFALEFESESELSLAISANILRVLREEAQPLREIPAISGVSKESAAMAQGVLRKKRFIEELPGAKGSRGKVIRLTPRGDDARHASQELIAALEARWQSRYGRNLIAMLRAALEEIAGDGSAQTSPLFRGLTPYPDGWRASVQKTTTLPQFPMVLHRGGYPDGS